MFLLVGVSVMSYKQGKLFPQSTRIGRVKESGSYKECQGDGNPDENPPDERKIAEDLSRKKLFKQLKVLDLEKADVRDRCSFRSSYDKRTKPFVAEVDPILRQEIREVLGTRNEGNNADLDKDLKVLAEYIAEKEDSEVSFIMFTQKRFKLLFFSG